MMMMIVYSDDDNDDEYEYDDGGWRDDSMRAVPAQYVIFSMADSATGLKPCAPLTYSH